jgi:hypothetical protein
MPWTIDEIQSRWLGGQPSPLRCEDIVEAFTVAEETRGREWVLISNFAQVYNFGKYVRAISEKMQRLAGAAGAEKLWATLLQEDVTAGSELTAVCLLRSRRPDTEVEFGPTVRVGSRQRSPDFRIRETTQPWIYVEVTQLQQSHASKETYEVLQRVADHVMSIDQPFLLEIVFWREPAQGEVDELVRLACEACQAPIGKLRDCHDLASVLVKSGNPAFLVPSILPDDSRPRMSVGRTIVGPGQPNRQIIVRLPFADQRAEDTLSEEAKQLPKDESGLVMVDVGGQPTAFESWSKLIPLRFARSLHTRVGGVILFMLGTTLTIEGLMAVAYLKLIPNPNARFPLPRWVTEVVDETRADAKRLTTFSD